MTSNGSVEVGVVNPKFLYQHKAQLSLTRLRVSGWNDLRKKLTVSDLDVHTLFGPFDLLCKHYITTSCDLPYLLSSYNISRDSYGGESQFIVEAIDKFEGFDLKWSKKVTLETTEANLQSLENIQRNWHSVPDEVRGKLIQHGAIFERAVTREARRPFPKIKAFVFIRLPVEVDEDLELRRTILTTKIVESKVDIQGLFWSSHNANYHCVVELSVPTLWDLTKFVMNDLQGSLRRIETATHIAIYPLTTRQVPISKFIQIEPKPTIRPSLNWILAQDIETEVEFKSTLRWDVKEGKENKKDLEKAVAKTVAAFMNTKGGILVIGIAPDHSTHGIEDDFKTLQQQDADGFLQQLGNVLSNYLGGDVASSYHSSIEEHDGKHICVVYVDRSPAPVFLKEKGKEPEFYIRVDNTSRPLNMETAFKYISKHWKS